MRAWHFNPWLSTLLISIAIAACLAYAGPVAAAGSPGSGGPDISPQSSPAPTPTAVAKTPYDSPVAEVQTSIDTEDAPTQPADALHDPVYWAVMGLVVLGHFVLVSDSHQGR